MIEQIKDRIEELGLKKTWVAAKAGIGQTELSNYLSGRRPLNEKKLQRVKDVLGMKKS